jgi:hypothetical protein
VRLACPFVSASRVVGDIPAPENIMASASASATNAQIDDILSLEHVRTQAQKVLQAARAGALTHFDYDESRMPEVADFVTGVIEVCTMVY